MARQRRLRFGFGMITLNAEEFIAQSIASVYDFADQIWVVDGCTPAGRARATPLGGSTDRTLEIVRSFPDPKGKLHVVPPAFYADKNEQSNAYMAAMDADPPDFVWQLDSDELYRVADLERIAEMIVERDAWHVSFRALHFWHGFQRVGYGSWWTGKPYRRINRFWRGARYEEHRPPTLRVGGRRIWEAKPTLEPEELEDEGIYLYHYSHVTEEQVGLKLEWYHRDGHWDRDWVERVWRRWSVAPDVVEREIGTHPINLRDPDDVEGKGSTRAFKGAQPTAIESHRAWVPVAPKPPRVLHVLYELAPGGGTRSPLACAARIAERSGVPQDVLTLAPSRFDVKVPPGVVHLDGGKMGLDAALRLAAGGGYDVIHWHWWSKLPRMRVFMQRMAAFGGHLRVLTCHSHPASAWLRLGEIERRYADVVVFDGDDTAAEYEGWHRNIRVIVASDELDAYASTPREPAPGFRMGRASTLDIWKVPGGFAEALAPVFRDVPGAEMHVFGDGPLRAAMAADVKRRHLDDKIRFRGYSDSLPAELAKLSAYVYQLPKRSYASSELALQAAMAAGLPIVVVPSDGVRWMFDHGRDSIVCQSQADIATALIELAADPVRARRIGEAARAKALGTWGADRMAARYLDDVYTMPMRYPLEGERPPAMRRPSSVRIAFHGAKASLSRAAEHNPLAALALRALMAGVRRAVRAPKASHAREETGSRQLPSTRENK